MPYYIVQYQGKDQKVPHEREVEADDPYEACYILERCLIHECRDDANFDIHDFSIWATKMEDGSEDQRLDGRREL